MKLSIEIFNADSVRAPPGLWCPIRAVEPQREDLALPPAIP